MRTNFVTRSILVLALVTAPILSGLVTHQADAAVANGKILFYTFRDGNGEIYTMNADGSNQVNLTNNAGRDETPYWSPDYSKIAFKSDRDGNDEIYIMNADGSGLTNVTNNPSGDDYPSWSPDGTKISFRSFRDSASREIYTANADGSGVTRVTYSAEYEGRAVWSPDGTKLLYSDGDIHTVNPDGTGSSNLTNTISPLLENIGPNGWSSDGTKIAYRGNGDHGNYEVYVMNANGTGKTRLTTNTAIDQVPYWSPDSTRLAYMSNRDGNNEIYAIDADGGNDTRLTNNTNYDYSGWMSWSPDGNYLLTVRETTDPYDDKLFRINSDGTGGDTMLGYQPDESWNYVEVGGWSAAVGASSSTTINASLSSVISISSSGTVAISLTPSGGAKMSSNSDTVSVSTNNTTGYALSLSNQDTTTTLANGGNTVAAHSGTLGSPTSLVANRWGFRVDSVGGFGAGPTSAETNVNNSAYSWAGVPSSAAPVQLKSTGVTASGDTTTVWYGVMVDGSIPNGAYSDTVTYTAVTN